MAAITAGGRDAKRMNMTAQGPAAGNCEAGAKLIGGVGSRNSPYLVSLIRPTIWYCASAYSASGFVRMILPMGFSPARYLRAKVSFTMATRGDFSVSRSVKSRPASNAICMVLKYSGLTQVNFDGPSKAPTRVLRFQLLPFNGICVE